MSHGIIRRQTKENGSQDKVAWKEVKMLYLDQVATNHQVRQQLIAFYVKK